MHGKGVQSSSFTHLRLEHISFALAIILIVGIGFYLFSSPVPANIGLVSSPAVLAEKNRTTNATNDLKPFVQERIVKFGLPNGKIITETEKITFSPQKNSSNQLAFWRISNYTRTTDDDGIIIIPDAVNAEKKENENTLLFQANPIGSAIVQPDCVKPIANKMYTGTVIFCPGVYALSDGILVKGPATIKGEGVVIRGPGTCNYPGISPFCYTGIFAYGKDVTIQGMTLENWGAGMILSPESIYDQATGLWAFIQGNAVVREMIIRDVTFGIRNSQEGATISHNSVTAHERPFDSFGTWDPATFTYIPISFFVGENAFIMEQNPPAPTNPPTLLKDTFWYAYFSVFIYSSYNAIVENNDIFIFKKNCSNCSYRGLEAFGSTGFTAKDNEIKAINHGISVGSPAGVENNSISLSPSKLFGAAIMESGGTIINNSINGNGGGVGIVHMMNWTGAFCSDPGGTIFGNTIKNTDNGYFENPSAQYESGLGNCVLTSSVPVIVSTNNFVQNTKHISNPNPPGSSLIYLNHYDSHPCIDQNPVDDVCENPYQWDPQGFYFWSVSNQDNTPAENLFS